VTVTALALPLAPVLAHDPRRPTGGEGLNLLAMQITTEGEDMAAEDPLREIHTALPPGLAHAHLCGVGPAFRLEEDPPAMSVGGQDMAVDDEAVQGATLFALAALERDQSHVHVRVRLIPRTRGIAGAELGPGHQAVGREVQVGMISGTVDQGLPCKKSNISCKLNKIVYVL